jgi:NADH:ubiquinone oxidoreductase subunit H
MQFISDIWQWCELHPWIWITFVAFGVTFGTVAYLILLERKTASWVQDRIGPNRVGFEVLTFLPGMGWLKGKFGGFGQPMADGLKFFTKEDYRPKGVHHRPDADDHRHHRQRSRHPLGRHQAVHAHF